MTLKILMVHNYYQQRGGEDAVFEAEVELLRAHGEQVETLTFHNQEIQTTQDRLLAGVNGIFNFSAIRRLKEKLASFQPDVMHVHNFFPLASPAVFNAARKVGVPSVMTVHNFRLICPNALLYRQGRICEECVGQPLPLSGIRHACYRNSRLQTAAVAAMTAGHRLRGTWRGIDRLICLNDFVRSKLLNARLGLSASQLVVNPNCVADPMPELSAGSDSASGREDFFLFVGRLTDEKGIATLIEAFEASEHSLKIIGNGPDEALVREAAGRNPRIEMLGFRDRPYILEMMRRCRALMVPSVWYENCPMSILEAFSTGTPVIASRIGALPGMITDGENGFLAEPGSPESFRVQLERTAQAADYPGLCRSARETYQRCYAPEAHYTQLMQIYQDILEEKHARQKANS